MHTKCIFYFSFQTTNRTGLGGTLVHSYKDVVESARLCARFACLCIFCMPNMKAVPAVRLLYHLTGYRILWPRPTTTTERQHNKHNAVDITQERTHVRFGCERTQTNGAQKNTTARQQQQRNQDPLQHVIKMHTCATHVLCAVQCTIILCVECA